MPGSSNPDETDPLRIADLCPLVGIALLHAQSSFIRTTIAVGEPV